MTSSWAGSGPSPPQSVPPVLDSKAKRANTRQLLSCTKCRERKVRCSRIRPCQACVDHGCSNDCKFVLSEGSERTHIEQSEEIKRLRREIQQLKQRLEDAPPLCYSDDDKDDGQPNRRGSTSTSRAAAARQRRFKTSSRIDNLYFGTPGLANIVQDFHNLQIGGQSLTHTLPKGKDMYTVDDTNYPFHIVKNYTSIESLLGLLPPRGDLFSYLDLFQYRAQSCSYPQTLHELPPPKREVECFLEDAERNANNSPDTLALLFAMLATGLQIGRYDRSGGKWIAGAVQESRDQSDVYIGASMQALRNASFMSRPTLRVIEALVLMGPYLTNSGRFLDAWTLFGTTIRLAHSIGLHRNPKLLDPLPPIQECTMRQTLWWWILHMDQQYSVTLGRPLGISGVGDCPPPNPLTTNPITLRLCQFIDQFTILARQILGSNDMMSLTTIDGFTDKLIQLWDTMPEGLQFTEAWLQQNEQLPEWPLDVISANLFVKIQSFFILLNRQRLEKTKNSASSNAQSRSGRPMSTEHVPSRAPQRGRPLVIDACVSILRAFMFFYHRQKAVLICWTMGQQAFNACMILILDAWETGNDHDEWWINQAYGVFVELHNKGVHKLAEMAVHRISSGLVMLEERRRERAQGMMSASRQQQQQPALQLDTAAMTDFSGDAVMGNTGMFLLEDSGSQFYGTQPAASQPLEWGMPGSVHPSYWSQSPTPDLRSPRVPVSEISVAPFPVIAGPTIPVTNSPYALGLQPRMPTARGRMPSHPSPYDVYHDTMDFTPTNTVQHPQRQTFPPHRGPVHQSNGHHSGRSSTGTVGSSHRSGTGPRSIQHSQRSERTPKSHRRR